MRYSTNDLPGFDALVPLVNHVFPPSIAISIITNLMVRVIVPRGYLSDHSSLIDADDAHPTFYSPIAPRTQPPPSSLPPWQSTSVSISRLALSSSTIGSSASEVAAHKGNASAQSGVYLMSLQRRVRRETGVWMSCDGIRQVQMRYSFHIFYSSLEGRTPGSEI